MDSRNKRQVTKNTQFSQSLGHALDGVKDLFLQERNFRFHVSMALLVVVMGLILRISVADWLWILLAIFSVIAAETVNTIVERVVDLIVGQHYNVIAKYAKDIAAGGVVISALFAVIIGSLIFIPIVVRWV